ncbi:unnamed protein product [Triticum aestivum]|uniref:Uncharacterized protein n=1 Tax=Triticum aestivum TaxID=4565 RepID=A0A7H4LPP2_WHEAT|nr:unnamed protein product [Triticum aestivum]
MSGQSQRLNVVPTVTMLGVVKARLIGATRGHALLKKKSDALTVQFRAILKKIVATKESMGEATSCSSRSAPPRSASAPTRRTSPGSSCPSSPTSSTPPAPPPGGPPAPRPASPASPAAGSRSPPAAPPTSRPSRCSSSSPRSRPPSSPSTRPSRPPTAASTPSRTSSSPGSRTPSPTSRASSTSSSARTSSGSRRSRATRGGRSSARWPPPSSSPRSSSPRISPSRGGSPWGPPPTYWSAAETRTKTSSSDPHPLLSNNCSIAVETISSGAGAPEWHLFIEWRRFLFQAVCSLNYGHPRPKIISLCTLGTKHCW